MARRAGQCLERAAVVAKDNGVRDAIVGTEGGRYGQGYLARLGTDQGIERLYLSRIDPGTHEVLVPGIAILLLDHVDQAIDFVFRLALGKTSAWDRGNSS